MIGRQVSDYKIIQELGKGGFGTVYLGENIYDANLRVTLKIVHKHLSKDISFMEHFQREVSVLSNLQSPHITRFQGLSQIDGQAVLIREYLEGEDLKKLLSKQKFVLLNGNLNIQKQKISSSESFRIIESVLKGLSHAHELGVLHGDIKPSNVFVCDDKTIKLLDFGISKSLDNTIMGKSSQILQDNLLYKAPELFENKSGCFSDVYSTGLLLWEMLTGKIACQGESFGEKMRWHMNQEIEHIGLYCPELSHSEADFVMKMCHRDIEKRPKDASEALLFMSQFEENGLENEEADLEKTVLEAKNIEFVDEYKEEQQVINDSKDDHFDDFLLGTQDLHHEEEHSKSNTLETVQANETIIPHKESSVNKGGILVGVFALLIALFSFGWHTYTSSQLEKQKAEENTRLLEQAKKMKEIKSPGKTTLGCFSEDKDECKNLFEKGLAEYLHEVEINRDYYIGVFEVTQRLYFDIMGENPSEFQDCGLECPVNNVNWSEAITFLNKMSEREGLSLCYEWDVDEWIPWDDCTGYRLPTKDEWEYAAKGGENYKYAGSDDEKEVGWYRGNSGQKIHPVGEKKSNGYDLYDMSGNVYEWVLDKYTHSSIDDADEYKGQKTVLSGSIINNSKYIRTYSYGAYREDAKEKFIGFRIAKTKQSP